MGQFLSPRLIPRPRVASGIAVVLFLSLRLTHGTVPEATANTEAPCYFWYSCGSVPVATPNTWDSSCRHG
uniref:Putative secreted protein n=1 Tax=Xenopsylla cheopis TaxID=163159 RepID=A0A6M2DZ08_XENCH